MKKVDVIVDLQYGSTGKGLIAGYLAKNVDYDCVVNANMPNAGHTFVDAGGRKWIHKVLPNGIVGESVHDVMIGPGSVFSLDQLRKECKESEDILRDKQIWIHENAMVLQEHHAKQEQEQMSKISSTMQGSSAAMVEKIRRDPTSTPSMAKYALKGTEFEGGVINNGEWTRILYRCKQILLEGAQGFSLGINAGFWPYCTSRDCTPARFVADCGIPVLWVRDIIGTARTYPIRVGNVPGGHSGGCYPDQRELQWGDIGVTPEKTTVTNRVRRVFTFSNIQITEAIRACTPTKIFLNFCNYSPERYKGMADFMDHYMDDMGMQGHVCWMGWGPSELDVVKCS